MDWDDHDTGEYGTMYLGNKNWINISDPRSAELNGGPQNRAATVGPEMVEVWLYAGMYYDITFEIAEFSKPAPPSAPGSDGYIDANKAYERTLWESATFRIKIPNMAHENREATKLTDFSNDGHGNVTATTAQGEVGTTKMNEYYVDCTNLDKSTGYDNDDFNPSFSGTPEIYGLNNSTNMAGDQGQVNDRWHAGRFKYAWVSLEVAMANYSRGWDTDPDDWET
jgi:hypothetical protein